MQYRRNQMRYVRREGVKISKGASLVLLICCSTAVHTANPLVVRAFVLCMVLSWVHEDVLPATWNVDRRFVGFCNSLPALITASI